MVSEGGWNRVPVLCPDEVVGSWPGAGLGAGEMDVVPVTPASRGGGAGLIE